MEEKKEKTKVRKKLVQFYQEEKYLKRVDAFWNAFNENYLKIVPAFKREIDFKVHPFMRKILKKVHPDLEYYFIPFSYRHMELTISIRSRIDLYPVVDMLWEKCRRKGRLWSFCFRRQKYSYDLVKFFVENRIGGNLDEFKFFGTLDRLNHINLMFVHKDATTFENQIRLVDQLCEGMQLLIGERNHRIWIGSFDLITQCPREEKIYPLCELDKFVQEKIEEAKKRLPKEPYATIDGTAQWLGIDFEPNQSCDYTGRSDMITCCTMLPEVIESADKDVRFYSERFSNFDEIFCYLKMERWKAGDEQDNDTYKENLIDELNMALRKNKMGMVTGTGTGSKYAYIDFVISNIPKAGRIIQSKLRKFKITKNAWILFFDSEKEAQWISIYDDTPPPPLPDFENRGFNGPLGRKLDKIIDQKLRDDDRKKRHSKKSLSNEE